MITGNAMPCNPCSSIRMLFEFALLQLKELLLPDTHRFFWTVSYKSSDACNASFPSPSSPIVLLFPS